MTAAMTLTQQPPHPDTPFWDKIAEKYSRDPITDMASYEQTLDSTLAHLNATDTVVELGCGTGTTALRLAGSVRSYLGTDLSPEMIRIARDKAAADPVAGLTFAPGEVEHGGLAAPGSVDAVLSYNHLHLVDDPARTIRAARDLLRPGGLLISKTMCMNEALKFRAMKPAIRIMTLLGKAPKTIRFFTIPELEAMVTEAGFEIIETADQAYPRRFIVARKV